MPLIVTSWPTGSMSPNSSPAVVGPRTVTAAAAALSASVMNRPLLSVRARTADHADVVPTTEVVQFVDPLTNSSDVCLVGATARMSGAATLEPSACASDIVNDDAEPSPPRTPDELVALPGVTISRLLPSAAI